MSKSTRQPPRSRPPAAEGVRRLPRPPSLLAQVELVLRQAIAEARFPEGKLPTAVVLAEQLGVSRETVRLATEALQAEGLLVKIRRRGTFLRASRVVGTISPGASRTIGYVQADFFDRDRQEEVANREIASLMLQGALIEAGRAEYKLEVRHTAHTSWRDATDRLCEGDRSGGVILASYSEEKVLRRLIARGVPTVLLDEDTKVARVHSVRDDSMDGARQAIAYLAKLGHRRIAYAHWGRLDSNAARPMGYRQGLRDAGLVRRRAWEIDSKLTRQGADELVAKFLSLSPRPTALYCFNNTLACLVIAALRKRRIDVPGQVSVFGAGGERVVGLTCHQANWQDMGRKAVQVLLRALAEPNRHKAEHHLCKHRLSSGQTTAPPPS